MIKINQLWFRYLDESSKKLLDSTPSKDQFYQRPTNQIHLTDCTEHTFAFFNLLTQAEATQLAIMRNCTQTGTTEIERVQTLKKAYPGFDFEGKFVSLIEAYNLLPADSATIGILEPDNINNTEWHAVIFAKNAINEFYLVDRQLQIKFQGEVNIIHYLNTYGFNTNRVGLYFVKSIKGGKKSAQKKSHKNKPQKNKLYKNKSRKNKSRKNRSHKNKN